MNFETAEFRNLLHELRSQTCEDSVDFWPSRQMQAMQKAGVFGWDQSTIIGGTDLVQSELLTGLGLLAAECLTSTFILTQRSAAVRRIRTSTNTAASDQLLPQLLNGDIFATVGISHLTTSGQHLRQPLVSVESAVDGWTLNGKIPWATSATQADVLVTGGTLKDGTQILTAVPTHRPGVTIRPPVKLLGLNASQTGEVLLQNVQITHDELLHGPVEGVMSSGSGGGAGSLATSALALGAASGTLRQFGEEATRRDELTEYWQPLQQECDNLKKQLNQAVLGSHPSGDQAGESIRQGANSLALRAAQAWLAATKGAGYVAGHPAERAVRESLFFLVWSCPRPVLHANLQELTCSAN